MVNTDLQNNNNNNNNNNNSRFNLVLCEILNKHLHGNDDNIDGNYLIINKFDGLTGTTIYSESDDDDYSDDDYSDYSEDDYSESSESSVTSLALFTVVHNNYYHKNIPPTLKHNIIRNYQNIIARSDYIKPEIAECIVLPSHHNIAIIKTIWIKLIQRKWKKIYAEREQIIKKRLQFASLYTRELTGKWPDYCARLPTIYGMLIELKYGFRFVN
jgi:hypothetical protein